MKLILKLAWRNIWRHKGKSLVIGFILFLGSILMTIGNGIINGMEIGYRKNIANSFTGDLIIISSEEDTNNVFMRIAGSPLSIIDNYPQVEEILKQREKIDQFLPANTGIGQILTSDSDPGYIGLIGVDIKKYLEFFPNSVNITEGQIFNQGERGIIITEMAREEIFQSSDFWTISKKGKLVKDKLTEEAKDLGENLSIKDELILMGLNKSRTATDIKIPVTGIYKYPSLNKLWGIYCIIDIESYREANNIISNIDDKITLTGEDADMLMDDDLDNMFLDENVDQKEETVTLKNINKKIIKNPASAYSIIYVRLKNKNDLNKSITNLNQIFKENKISAKAVSWKDSIGHIGNMAVFIKAALNTFIIFIFFVAIIVIMNTLSMTAMERVSEIGMMRAIGAKKSFLRYMFLAETGYLSFFFGGIGIFAGIIVILILQSMGITTDNEFLQMVYGGDKLNPFISISSIISAIIQLGIVSLIAVAYPLKVVGKIVPLDAISRE